MKFRIIPQFLFSILLFSFIASAIPNGAAASEDNEKIHIVVKGDTLWDISEKYFDNPFFWPKLWQWNEFISNPHFIYPGDRIKLYPPKLTLKRKIAPKKEMVEEIVEEELAVVEEAAVPETEPVAEVVEEGEKIFFPEIRSSGLVSSEEMKEAGKIVDARDDRVMLSDDDIIYLQLKDKPEQGDRYTAFRTEKMVRHPVTNKPLGFKVVTLGFLEVTGFSEGVVIAKITKSFDAIYRDDLVTLKEEIPENISIKKSTSELEGYIVAAREERINFGEGDIVYIDQGKDKGLEAGNIFIAYRKGEKKGQYVLPSTTIGRLVVLHSKKQTSIAIIIKSVEEMNIGERIKSEVQ